MIRNRLRLGFVALRLAFAGVITLGLASMPADLEAQQEPAAGPSVAIDDETETKQQKKKKKEERVDSDEGEVKKGPSFIPIPIFITEPAIGNGFGVALGYFHPTKDPDDSDQRLAPGLTAGTVADTGNRQKRPPTISGIAAAYTDNDTWGAGVGHSASWAKDTIRYKGALGYAHVVSEFFFLNQPFKFILEGGLLTQDVKFRLGKSDFWVGGKLTYVNADLGFRVDIGDTPIDFNEKKIQDFGLGLQAIYEGRDNLMTPNSGQFVELVTTRYFESGIGDFDYFKLDFQVQSFHELVTRKLVLGLRLDIAAVDGEPPLWGYPWIVLRGVPALRYQNEKVGVVEAELRWNFLKRWAAVGFYGGGRTEGDAPQYVDEDGITAYGVGGRYLFRPQDSLWVGIDLARGPEQDVFYIQMGHAW